MKERKRERECVCVTERHRETQRDTERHRETQRDTETGKEISICDCVNPFSVPFVHFRPLSSTFVHFRPLSFPVVHFRPLLLTSFCPARHGFMKRFFVEETTHPFGGFKPVAGAGGAHVPGQQRARVLCFPQKTVTFFQSTCT
jgi:hypothetical protein